MHRSHSAPNFRAAWQRTNASCFLRPGESDLRYVFPAPWPGISSNENSCLRYLQVPAPDCSPLATLISRHQAMLSPKRNTPGLVRSDPVIGPGRQRREGTSTRGRAETRSTCRSRAVVKLLASDVSSSEQQREIQSRAKRARGRVMYLAVECNRQQRPLPHSLAPGPELGIKMP